ncbi:putative bacteriocin export ABC transporter [Anaeromicropila populeti]|uniref:Putative ABC transport system ATP-binding protein n=1 Tax=Anaeromicropila populeti TaxID=37658 RepID=A0A1I6KRV0_9FIRM|nr:putative bacteriocin export ABC transporter [Anaeromicropila populeti]SFR93973.1 putative ABC transport system ATP-binding protein [Anaeromicropila populeti]
MSVIKLEGVGKNFQDKEIIKELNLEVELGEMVAIVGKSGKGKSTLLNMIGLISEKTNGDLYICGKKNVKIHSKDAIMLRRKKIGYLFQNYALADDETVLWNLELALVYKNIAKSEKRVRIDSVLEQLGLLELKKIPVYKLSGGEQQRVAMARLILQESEVILADEPTGSLDTENRDIILELLKQLKKQGKAVVIVTHDSYVAQACDRVITL